MHICMYLHSLSRQRGDSTGGGHDMVRSNSFLCGIIVNPRSFSLCQTITFDTYIIVQVLQVLHTSMVGLPSARPWSSSWSSSRKQAESLFPARAAGSHGETMSFDQQAVYVCAGMRACVFAHVYLVLLLISCSH
jgi:hypothetical protein